MSNFIKGTRATKVNLLIRSLFACSMVATLSFVAVSTRAGDAEDKANQALADWKAANQAVADAKADLEKARTKQQTEMDKARYRKKNKQKDDAQDKQLEEARAEVAAAEAALEKAEAALLAARVALEKAIAELPDGDLKEKLKRERRYPSLASSNVSVTTGGGLSVVTFSLSAGRLLVRLPDDMMAGDTISGTVVAEPKGSSQEERSKNQDTLNGYVIEVGGTKVKGPEFHWTVPPAPPTLPPLRYKLQVVEVLPGNASPRTIAGAEITPAPKITEPKQPSGAVVTPDPKTTPDFIIPALGQTGRPIVITGPFDGDSSNTTAGIITGKPLEVLAESPRESVFSNPAETTGPTQVTVKDGDKQTTGMLRNLRIDLTAPKTNLRRGESTELRIEVQGLEGIKDAVPLTIESHGVITMQGGMYQPLMIQPSQVSADGRYSTTRSVTGVQPGGWSATATVVTYSMDVMIEGENCDRHLGFNSVTGEYYVDNCPTCSTLRDQTPVFSLAPIGKGSLTQSGCTLTLEDNTPDRRVMAKVDQCAKSGMATVEMPAKNVKFTITDRNISNNTCAVH